MKTVELTATSAERPAANATDRVIAPMARRRLLASLAALKVGRLTVHLPDASVIEAGQPEADLHATMWITHDAFFRKFALGGDLGAGESYMDGDWHTDDLCRFTELVLRNQAYLPLGSWLSRVLNLPNDWLHVRRRNSRRGSRRNIGAHYDLSNELFETFLDPSLAYSSAVFHAGDEPLATAQEQKFEQWCDALRIGPSDHVLEIGSGWGGFAMHAARTRGCKVTGITVSEQQLTLSRQRIADAGLSDRIAIEFCDYRDVRGQFSRVVSIEMIEAVGERYWPAFFRKIDEVLAPGGLAGIQAITMVDHRFDEYRRHCDWIQKYIFPGGLLPSVREIAGVCADETKLGLIALEDRPLDYARTLLAWRRAFLSQLDRVRDLGFDDRFIRMWEYYLATCEAAFRTRNLGLVHLVLARAADDLT